MITSPSSTNRSSGRTSIVGSSSASRSSDPQCVVAGRPAAALAVDAARAEPGDPLRRAYADGMRHLVDGMERIRRKSGDDSPDEGTILVELSTMIGALVLSRACAGDDLSDRILTAVRDHVLGDDEQTPEGKDTSDTAG
ncbi:MULTISPECIES: hypothetical protein [Streptomyces]|uniref:hypothetical protein n=1 Tax=Streptomyces TaxID=1883 RepID=UPI00163D11E2|nr:MULTISPECIES: hypothetical protein [unclassified Streptomyces]AJZ86932.2 hypothetical protein AS97_18725 [Streptomyces sp. AgN23]WTA86097.1 hypothetical protein OG751_43000 [Streptomyces antimycoticus]WTB03343.1 hypothetical protein OG546_03330 [Streptomyces antimycoticus]